MDGFQFLLTGEGRQGMGNGAHRGEEERGYLWPGLCGEGTGKEAFPSSVGFATHWWAGRGLRLRGKDARSTEGSREKGR